LASASNIAANGAQPGGTPFISFVRLQGDGVANLAAVRYTIQPKAGTASLPVDVTYEMAALMRRGYVANSTGTVTLPVFGLYAGHVNRLTIELQFIDRSVKSVPYELATAAFTDPSGVYDQPTILTKRMPGSVLGLNYFAMKSALGTPVVVDSDGEVRWLGTGAAISNAVSYSSALQDNAFVVGDSAAPKITRLELDGTYTISSLVPPSYLAFHHNIDPGKNGLLAEMNTADGATTNLESVAIEMTSTGVVLNEWNFAALLSNYMRSHGDDPTAFVRPGIDWFHMNATTYDPRDDSLIVSSRENFVIKVDYRSGDIVWIFGDPTKYWYSFASLRAKALTLQGGGLYPVGQHATSITSDGLLMLFNDGLASVNQPTGAPVGENRTYSAVSAYAIDPVARTAREAWRFDNRQSIYSDICSSAYEGKNGSILVSYAAAENRATARVVGLDSNHTVAFDFKYSSPFPCATSWNAIPIAFEQMRFR
jgi:arylsulfate sulfotransferase